MGVDLGPVRLPCTCTMSYYYATHRMGLPFVHEEYWYKLLDRIGLEIQCDHWQCSGSTARGPLR